MTPALSPTSLIGDLARERPSLLPVFDRLGLDYCCHGAETMARACERAGVGFEALASAADAEAISAPSIHAPTPQSMTSLCDEIESTHHAFVRDVFARLDTLLPRVVAAHGAAHPELLELEPVLRNLREDMMDHMVREERVLFPWLRRLEEPGAVHFGPPWSVKRPIDCMRHDHDDVAAALAKTRALTNGYTPPPNACGSYRGMIELLRGFDADTRRHVHKENNILFPAGEAAEAARAARQTPRESCSCAGPGHEPRDACSRGAA